MDRKGPQEEIQKNRKDTYGELKNGGKLSEA
jgi:hypothetical protein